MRFQTVLYALSGANNMKKTLRKLKRGKKKTGRLWLDANKFGKNLKVKPLRMRRIFQNAASASNYSSRTIFCSFRHRATLRVSNALEPIFTDRHEIKQLQWCTKFIDGCAKAFHSM